MKKAKQILLASVAFAIVAMPTAKAIGWPSGFEGVMLQGFYWDSYEETNWANLESRVDELSPYFKLIWVPNSGKAANSTSMGYDPVYWFTNHNSSFGTEAQLRSMIAAYKAAGTGIMADVVLNHRNGATNWVDFPAEEWNGVTYQIGTEGICCDDEVWTEGGDYYANMARGTYDEREGFNGARDLDHTNSTVQDNCKAYCKFLLEDIGYAGFRLDMVKGYAGYYTKMYNQYSQPTYSVGEYFDSNYDLVAAWIEDTGGESAAFDFPFKYAVNEAFASGDMTKLVWYEDGTTPKPAGMIHHWYQQLAVTFIDNHDTYRDGSKFQGNWAAANAFMICSPGTPCVFLEHWNACGDQIANMIKARNAMGVSNTSQVTVLRTNSSCYMAEIVGSKGKLVVKVGSEMVSPDGYTDSQIACSGEDYCIWTSTAIADDDTLPTELYLIGNVNGWDTTTSIASDMAVDGVFTWNEVDLCEAASGENSYFTFVTAQGADWDAVNSYSRYGASTKDEVITSTATIKKFSVGIDASSAYSWQVAPAKYKVVADLNDMKVTITKTGDSESGSGETGGETGGGDEGGEDAAFVVYFDNSNNWASPAPKIYAWNSSSTLTSSWPGEAMTLVSGKLWKWESETTPSGIIFTDGKGSGDSNKAGSSDITPVNGATYRSDGKTFSYPSTLYLIGNFNNWDTSTSVASDAAESGVYTWNSVSLTDSGNTYSYFSFVTKQGSSWSTVNGSDRYGADSNDELISGSATMTRYLANDNASSASAWKVEADTYKVVADVRTSTLSISKTSGIEEVEAADEEIAPVYYNLQGVKVEMPAAGVYIMVRGNKASKVVIR